MALLGIRCLQYVRRFFPPNQNMGNYQDIFHKFKEGQCSRSKCAHRRWFDPRPGPALHRLRGARLVPEESEDELLTGYIGCSCKSLYKAHTHSCLCDSMMKSNGWRILKGFIKADIFIFTLMVSGMFILMKAFNGFSNVSLLKRRRRSRLYLARFMTYSREDSCAGKNGCNVRSVVSVSGKW